MGFAPGKLKRLIQGPMEEIAEYKIVADWLEDVNGKRGWVLQIIRGPEQGTFSVVDGGIYPSKIVSSPLVDDDSMVVHTGPDEAKLSKSTVRVMWDAIAKWEREASEKPRT